MALTKTKPATKAAKTRPKKAAESKAVESPLVSFARSELERAGFFDRSSLYGGMLGDAVLRLVEQFVKEGHSGASGSIALAAFAKVADWQPLTPLTGEADEWIEFADGKFQNRRCSRVFKDGPDGQAYDIEGIVWEDEGGRYTNRDSRVSVTFPYVPTTEIRKRDLGANTINEDGTAYDPAKGRVALYVCGGFLLVGLLAALAAWAGLN